MSAVSVNKPNEKHRLDLMFIYITVVEEAVSVQSSKTTPKIAITMVRKQYKY